MKILLLCRYDSLGASSRLRFFQYLPYLRNRGCDIDVLPLLNDEYLKNLYSSKKANFFSICVSYVNRAMKLLTKNQYDIIWVEGEIFPWVPAIAEFLLFLRTKPYVVDYDDAIFHRYDLHKNAIVRLLLGRKIDAVMKHSAIVVVGNDYLYDRAKQAGASQIEYLPTVIDLNRYELKTNEIQKNNSFVIGWVGTQVTAQYLELVAPPLLEINRQKVVEFISIGPENLTYLKVPWKTIPWTEKSEVLDISSFDVGIMPLEDGCWEKGKCGYKLIQYMACGLPVIASAVGVNTKIVEHNKTGFLASTKEDWVKAISTLIDNPGHARKMGKAGRIKVENEYCLQVTAPKMMKLLEKAAKYGH